MSKSYQIILSTFPDRESAEHCARLLVSLKLAACVNLLPGITSFYWWREQMQASNEFLLLIKAEKSFYSDIENTLLQHHPYELPEIVALPIDCALQKYLHWIDSCHSTD